MSTLELVIFLVGGCLCGSILIVAYLEVAIALTHKIDKEAAKKAEQKMNK
jgi:hypothetical protein